MTKTDREKMKKRFHREFERTCLARSLIQDMHNFVAREVDSAVRAERKAQRETDEPWASHRRRADEQLIERAKGLGRK